MSKIRWLLAPLGMALIGWRVLARQRARPGRHEREHLRCQRQDRGTRAQRSHHDAARLADPEVPGKRSPPIDTQACASQCRLPGRFTGPSS
jgi:hypothetical protein